ncbi:hypothetical protein SLEP1_g60104 [Rubroshorea leprosula]|nr:hypothetical protein SLEP1_g60104 [Rubroshorea leprosula]
MGGRHRKKPWSPTGYRRPPIRCHGAPDWCFTIA